MRVRKLFVPLAASLALLAGCKADSPANQPEPDPSNGLEALEVDAIIDATKQTLERASSFRVKGSVTNSGDLITLDIVFVRGDLSGTISNNGVEVEVLVVDGATYLKAGPDFWSMFLGEGDDPALPALLSGKYVVVPENPFPFSAEELLTPEGTVTRGEVTVIDGKSVIALNSSRGGTLYVALVGEPYPVKLVNEGAGELAFLDIDADVTLTAPPAAEVIDPSTLG